jgi:tetratricopeptide (TPR) repeat protein
MAAEMQLKIDAEPGNLNYRRALADYLVKAGRLTDALEALRQAQTLTGGGDPQIDRIMGRVRKRILDDEIDVLRARQDDALLQQKVRERDDFLLSDAQAKVRQYPNDREFNFEYGVLLYERGRVEDAAQQFQSSQRSPKRRIDSLYYLGLCFKSKQLYDLAGEQFTTAAGEIQGMSGTKKVILYELAQVAEALGQADEARDRYKEIYAVDIGYKNVAEKVERPPATP